MSVHEEFDVVVVGAGPAGSSAAGAAAAAGARVALLDRAEFPRYKTCGGGLIGATWRLLGDPNAPVLASATRASFTHEGRRYEYRETDRPFLRLTSRDLLDNHLLNEAVKHGAQPFPLTKVRGFEIESGGVSVVTDRGALRSKTLVGADGSASSFAKSVGTRMRQVDLGLEVELDAAGQGSRWDELIHLDWGPLPGSYAWVFPKDGSLTVGVIAAKGQPAETRAYLQTFLEQQGLTNARILRHSGHLTQCRDADSPLGMGPILLAGDAAGLLEPWTREGISFAIRSGKIAGEVCARRALDDNTRLVVEDYIAALQEELLPEMTAGFAFMRAFEQNPGLVHFLLGGTSVGWDSFARICRGETSIARAYRHRTVRFGLGALVSLPRI